MQIGGKTNYKYSIFLKKSEYWMTLTVFVIFNNTYTADYLCNRRQTIEYARFHK
jgi:hypothetical protein